jgi:hypothetical protein
VGCSVSWSHRSHLCSIKRRSVDRISSRHITSHRTLITRHCSPDTAHQTLLTIHCSPYTAHHTLLTIHCSPYTAHHTLLTIHCSPDALLTRCTARHTLLAIHSYHIYIRALIHLYAIIHPHTHSRTGYAHAHTLIQILGLTWSITAAPDTQLSLSHPTLFTHSPLLGGHDQQRSNRYLDRRHQHALRRHDHGTIPQAADSRAG